MKPRRRDNRAGAASGANGDARGQAPRRNDAPAAASDVAISAGPALSPDLAATLDTMLAAVVRMAGAGSGVVRLATPNSARLEVQASAGFAGGDPAGATGPIALWCSRCPESQRPGSECTASGICGRDERFPADLRGRACRHIYSLPLEGRDRPVGVLNLRFDSAEGWAASSVPALTAGADLMGTALAQARVARERLRIALTNERQMIANEVHDSLAQGLTYMRMRMSLLRHALREGDSERALKYWSDVDGSLTDAHRRLRELITYFRCRMDSLGLLHALQETSEKFLDRTGVALEFANGVPGLDLPVAREVQVFHIVQEALANVCKHADARRARLTLASRGDGYEITVEDDGVGMAADVSAGDRAETGHYGISIMRERARRLGGELTVDSAPGAGTRVRLYFPAVDPPTESTL